MYNYSGRLRDVGSRPGKKVPENIWGEKTCIFRGTFRLSSTWRLHLPCSATSFLPGEQGKILFYTGCTWDSLHYQAKLGKVGKLFITPPPALSFSPLPDVSRNGTVFA